MFVKSTVTLFVLAVGLLSFLSGSASAYPRPGELSISQAVNDDSELKLFEGFWARKPENSFSSNTYLHQNAIQGSNSTSENHLASEFTQNHVVIKGNLPTNGQNFGPLTIGSYNTIQESDSKTKNVLGTVVIQNDVVYDFKPKE
uniref:BV7 family protein n=1 Tax=Cotesia sesamiae Kitale bracovirus TaxID=452648 RepID=S0DH40_9VIRU|nr:conserved hypothetical protein BV7 [Cotesia sesamiae Kitale bracovirus]